MIREIKEVNHIIIIIQCMHCRLRTPSRKRLSRARDIRLYVGKRELFERCFLEYDVLELSDIDANTNGAHPSSIVRLKGYLRSWNVSGARSVSDFGANALCFITSEKLARFRERS